MDYGLISKIQKAKRYAQEKDRIQIESLMVTFKDGEWRCDCMFFRTRGRCSHTMALEIILEDMLPEPATVH